ncbi:MAG: hypothetical protein ABJ327_02900 [Litoreibacter sp.]
MTKEMNPRRAGVTRKLPKLQSEKKQAIALDDAECEVVFSWAEFMGTASQPPVHHSFLDEDVVVIVDSSVLKADDWPFVVEVIGGDMTKPKAKRGPKAKLDAATPDQWFAINWVYTYTKPKEANAIALAAAFGIEADRNAIFYRSNKEKKEALLKGTKEDQA